MSFDSGHPDDTGMDAEVPQIADICTGYEIKQWLTATVEQMTVQHCDAYPSLCDAGAVVRAEKYLDRYWERRHADSGFAYDLTDFLILMDWIADGMSDGITAEGVTDHFDIITSIMALPDELAKLVEVDLMESTYKMLPPHKEKHRAQS
ncbi:hypothetical protein LCGC14_0163560 [marine sediment metagenome]|uniref:Uncharacterized protein n=1 Tax=marine sediment metagenome TaxID=412755 RepID=A0A0F9VAB1_9ZZZZ